MTEKKILFGVHNDQYIINLYDDMTINIYDYVNELSVTDFEAKIVALFMALLKRDGHLDTLLEIDAERLRKLGFDNNGN